MCYLNFECSKSKKLNFKQSLLVREMIFYRDSGYRNDGAYPLSFTSILVPYPSVCLSKIPWKCSKHCRHSIINHN